MISPHILRGYRVGHAPGDLILSLLTLHNETGNIWTHLLGGVLYAYYWTTNLLTVDGMTWADIRFGQLMLMLGMAMFICSTIYHTMKDNWWDKTSTSYYLKFDFVGVRANAYSVRVRVRVSLGLGLGLGLY
jgi:predicted membrane channel-forming protein YqfA (hemolysin III family)